MKKEDGYSSILFIILGAAILLTVFSLYDNSQIASERIKIQNTADSVAYSTLNTVTRDMNFIAYTNRSMVANQVAIGQMVGLSSWFGMTDQAVQNINTVAKFFSWVPYVGQVANAITNILANATKQAKNAFNKVSSGVIFGIDKLIAMLSGAQHAVQLATVDMAKATFEEVAKANDPNIKLGLLSTGYSYLTVIDSYKDEVHLATSAKKSGGGKTGKLNRNRFNQFANIVADSRDPFSRNRSYPWADWSIPLPNPLRGLGVIKVSIQKKGGSDFMQAPHKKNLKWEWTAMDTVSFWGDEDWIGTCHKWGVPYPCPKQKTSELSPLGWGAAHALNSDRFGNKTTFNYSGHKKSKQPDYYVDGLRNKLKSKEMRWGNGAWKNSMSASLGAWDDAGNNLRNISGLRSFYTLKSDVQKNTGPSIVAMVEKTTASIPTQKTLDDSSSTYNRPNNMVIEQYGSAKNNTLYGLSKAEIYFSRPKDIWGRSDSMHEYANLYNPFWQTRLVENTAFEKNIAYGQAHLVK